MKEKKHVIHKRSKEVAVFRAGDHTLLKEVIHPKNDGIDIPYSLASALLEKGENSLPHRLSGSETYFFTAGNGHMLIDGKRFEVEAGDAVFVPESAEQQVSNDGTGQLRFLCIVSPAWSEEGEELL